MAGGPAPAAEVQQPPAPVAAKSGSGLKILMILLAGFVATAILVVGGMFYAAHRVKQAVVEKAASYGVDLHSSPSPSPSARNARRVSACDLLSKEDAARLLDEPIERTEDQSGACLYYGPAGLSVKLAREGAANTFKRAQAPGSDVGGGEIADTLTKLLGSVAAAQQPGGGDAPLLTLLVDWSDGKAQMTALSILNAGVARSEAVKGGVADIPNLGDRAIRLGNLGLNVLKGDALIRIVPGPVPDANGKAIALARAILPKV
ncbi:MAG TPA: hypothetical protein VLW25_09500 [Bryobacteraceae bacterium]|nr:hypothetical protein [Bryobacteraceae bacterium]